jgi:ribosomal protein L32E
MAEKKSVTKRNKPKFLRTCWHKSIKLGMGVKKKLKWRAAKGRHNKIRLGRKGKSLRPKVGWSADSRTRGFVGGMDAAIVRNVKDVGAVKTGQGIIIANVGLRKRNEIIKKANEMKLSILNKYIEEKK